MGEFGQLLRQLRETHGHSIEHVTQTTRVPTRHLLALESEQFQSLPSDASARGFVRLLAKHYRVDEQELVRHYERAVAPHAAAAQPLPLAQTNATIFKVQSGRPHTGLGVGVGLIVAILLLFGWMRGMPEHPGSVTVARGPAKADKAQASRPASQPAVQQEKPRPTDEQKVATIAPPSAPSKSETMTVNVQTQPAAIPSPSPKPESPSIRLEIEAHDQSWVQAALDGGEMKEAMLKAGERLTWTATEQMELTLGNAGGLALSFNGAPMASLGEPGQVVRLHLTKDGPSRVKRSPLPRQPQPPPSATATPPPSAPSTFAF